MAEPRDLVLARNVIAILHSLDRADVPHLSGAAWGRFTTDPCLAFLKLPDDDRRLVWAAVQARLPTALREGAAG